MKKYAFCFREKRVLLNEVSQSCDNHCNETQKRKNLAEEIGSNPGKEVGGDYSSIQYTNRIDNTISYGFIIPLDSEEWNDLDAVTKAIEKLEDILDRTNELSIVKTASPAANSKEGKLLTAQNDLPFFQKRKQELKTELQRGDQKKLAQISHLFTEHERMNKGNETPEDVKNIISMNLEIQGFRLKEDVDVSLVTVAGDDDESLFFIRPDNTGFGFPISLMYSSSRNIVRELEEVGLVESEAPPLSNTSHENIALTPDTSNTEKNPQEQIDTLTQLVNKLTEKVDALIEKLKEVTQERDELLAEKMTAKPDVASQPDQEKKPAQEETEEETETEEELMYFKSFNFPKKDWDDYDAVAMALEGIKKSISDGIRNVSFYAGTTNSAMGTFEGRLLEKAQADLSAFEERAKVLRDELQPKDPEKLKKIDDLHAERKRIDDSHGRQMKAVESMLNEAKSVIKLSLKVEGFQLKKDVDVTLTERERVIGPEWAGIKAKEQFIRFEIPGGKNLELLSKNFVYNSPQDMVEELQEEGFIEKL